MPLPTADQKFVTSSITTISFVLTVSALAAAGTTAAMRWASFSDRAAFLTGGLVVLLFIILGMRWARKAYEEDQKVLYSAMLSMAADYLPPNGSDRKHR